MTKETFNASINAFCKPRPFKPFTIALMDGDQFEVDHPTAILNRGGTAVYLSPGGVPVIFDYEGVTQIIGDLKEQPA
jgi:hypothetical protein